MKYILNRIVLLSCFLIFFCPNLIAEEPIPYGTTVVKDVSYSPSGSLVVNGTLIVYGDLTMGFQEDLEIGTNGILIVFGTITIGKNVDVDASGYLIADNFHASGENGGKFDVGSESKVYIDNVTIDGEKINHLDVLKPENHREIDELKDGVPNTIWQVYIDALSKLAGTIKFEYLNSSCFGASLPSMIQVEAAGPQYQINYWEYSSDKSIWTRTGSVNVDLVFTSAFPDPGLPHPDDSYLGLSVGTYYFRRKAVKKNDNSKEVYSNTLTVTVNPQPHPIGIFF